MARADKNEEDTVSEERKLTAKEARQKIFQESKSRVEYLTYKGIDLEIRQPTVSEFINSNTVEEGEKRDASKVSVAMLVRYTYLRGTDDRIFEDSDVDVLLASPMNGEFLQLIGKMNSLLDIKVEAEVKN